MSLAALLFALQTPVTEPAPEAAARPRGWDGFPVFVWREQYAGRPLPEELIAPFGGTLVMREEPAEWIRAAGHEFLVFNAAGREPLHRDADATWNSRVERWIETRDQALLVREPCLSDPATRERIFETLAATLRARGGDHGLGLALGDEVGLTPNGDPFESCPCEHCEASWRAYAKARGLPERAPSTDEVRLALLEDDASLVGAWLARRRFEDEQLVKLLRLLSAQVRIESRELSAGLLGLAGDTAFGGVDPARLADVMSFFECYPTVDTRERLGDVRGESRSLTTVFLQDETPDGAAWVAWEHWMRGGDGLVLWSDALLEKSPAHRERLAATVASIREIEARLPGRERRLGLPNVAVIHDRDSNAVGWLRDALLDGPTWPRRRASQQRELGTRERKTRTWLRVLEDQGFEVASLELAALRGVTPSLVVLPEMLVLDEEDVRDLEGYLDHGGRVVIDGRLGWLRRDGRPWQSDVAARLRARAPERVLAPPSAAGGYLEAREDPAVRERMRTFLAPVAPDRRVTSRSAPLLVVWRARQRPSDCFPAFDEPEIVFILQNRPSAEERRRLTPLELEFSEGCRIEWLHPARPGPVPAGDAAVLLVTPER